MPAFLLSEHVTSSGNWLIIISDKDKYFPDQQTILWCASNPHKDAKFFQKMH